MAYSNIYARVYTAVQESFQGLVKLWQITAVRAYFIALVVFQALVWFQAINIYRHVKGNLLILHYNIDFGVDLIGEPKKIFYYPLAGLALALFNILLSVLLRQRRDFKPLLHMLMLAAIVCSIFLSLALLSVYTVNFR